MPEQPQWSERTLDMPPQDPWAEPQTTPTRYAAGQDHPQTHPTRAQPPQNQPAQNQPAQNQPAQGRPPQHQTQVQATAPFSPAGPAAPQSGPPSQPAPAVEPSPFSKGRARVTPRTEQAGHGHAYEPTSTGWTPDHSDAPAERKPLSWHIRRLRRGSEWSNAPLVFAFLSWGIWVLSSKGSMVTPVVVFLTSLVVAAGVFALARLAGRLVLERQLGRVRHTARGAHMVTGVFLIGVGLAHLRQTEWVMTAVTWVTDLF